MIVKFLGLVFLRLGVSNFYVWGLVFLRLGVSDSYVCVLVFLRLRVSNSYVWGLVTRDALRGHTVSKNGSISFFFFFTRSYKSVH